MKEEEEIIYLIDANIFMQAARTYYSFDIAQPFWDALVEFGNQGRIISIDKVFQEIKEGDDRLREWAVNEFVNYFDNTQTEEILECYAELVKWANSQSQYTQKAKDDFMEETNADAWVVAYAIANNCMVVTSERQRPDSKKIIPIPNVCSAFDILCCDTFDLLKKLSFTF